ncbi:N-acetyltransferase [Billgrantia antri]|uniref:N-acetyltransferase n=1 Tax=Halomonas sulfidivorans TaxID=2733488 RepID=A0ABX7WCM5_9GAMM|nr:N-acetyltransferase [Halomonas sulfidivorans]QTP57791.1 N-acetyltransferase [Halomonas sulfidivorans]
MATLQPILRSETPGDAEAIEAVTVAAFREAPHTSHTEQHIVRALRAAGALAVSLVAECDGELVGHVAASPVTLSDGTSGWFGLGPVSVLPAWQGRGIGSALVRACLARLRERGARGCVLVGEPGYYQRFGFRSLPGLILSDVPPEYFMALSWFDERPQARVIFHPAFTATA